jgi:two-component system NtrC family response regulator
MTLDDDKSILNIFSRILRRQGYKVETAETGQEAIEKLQTREYDLALIDIKLPDTNGLISLPEYMQLTPK